MIPRAQAILVSIAIGVTVTVIAIATFTRERIAANERAWFVARLEALVPAALRDNDLYADRIIVSAPDFLGDEPSEIFRARRDGRPTAAILTARASDGYGGTIELLIGVDSQGTLLGVDVLRHRETAGIGDGFLPQRSDWLSRLKGRSLDNTSPARFTIRKDGGDFDQFTGASITPRAILKAVRRTLEYFESHHDVVFAPP